MKTFHILTDEELSMIKGQACRIEQLENENKTLREFNAKHHERISNLKRSVELCNKALADKTKHELAQEAELASQGSTIMSLQARIKEMERDNAGTSKALAEAKELADGRLKVMNNLEKALFDLKRHRFAVVVNPRTKTIRVVSMCKIDTYRKFGWGVLAEDLLAEIPA